MCFNSCWGGAKKRETDFSLSYLMPGQEHKFKYRKFCLNVSKIKTLYYMIVKHWKRQPRDVVTSSFLKYTENQGGHDPGRPASWSNLSSYFGLDLQRCLPTSISLWFCDSVISICIIFPFLLFNNLSCIFCNLEEDRAIRMYKLKKKKSSFEKIR